MNRLQANLCLLCVTLCWSAEVILYACVPDGVPAFATSCVTSPEGVHCRDKEGRDIFYPAEKVIYAVGQRPLQEEALALKFCATEFYMIGDCVAPKNIANATAQAHDVAANLGRI